jgi:GTP cyclohydrolase I|tara:strand:+ start:1283 stop:1819 length:537 start_codon:yes stop_codon:yes gene_type:complete
MASALEKNIKQFISLVGEDVTRDGLIDTPGRVAKAWGELLTAEDFTLTTFDSNGYDEMIISRGITYYTFCEHHLLPFFGVGHIGYIPNGKIVGLSKLARTVEYYSRRLNTQEYLTDNIAETLNDALKPKGIGVIIEGRHLCQEMRGIKKQGKMITSALRGIFLEDKKAKQEFFKLCVQ